MWPRSDATVGPGSDMTASRKSKNTGLNGFVSFMTRRDAEDALREFDGYDWGGSVLRVGWSKAVPIATKPLYGSYIILFVKMTLISRLSVSTSAKTRGSRSRSRSRSHSPDHRAHRIRDPRYRSRRSRSPSRDRDRSRSPRRYGSCNRSHRYDSSPSRSPRRQYARSPQSTLHDDSDAVTDTFIRAVAAEVKGHDTKYEETLRDREKSNPKYNFLLRRDVSCLNYSTDRLA